MKTGLVIEGGGVRGIYAAGVLDVFMEYNICFDGLIGVSAGAVHGCSYLSGQRGRSLRYYKKYCNDSRFMSFTSWIKTGDIVGAEFCYHELPDKLDVYDHDAFLNNQTDYFVTCSNVETGKPEYLKITDMRTQIDSLRASASLPYFSKIVEINGKKYLDGGITDSVPVEAFREMGYKRTVVILTRELEYRKKPELRMLPGLVYRKYPAFVKALQNRYRIYNKTIERILELEKNGDIFVIRPSAPLEAGRMEKDPEKVQMTYEAGYQDAMMQMKALKNWLKIE